MARRQSLVGDRYLQALSDRQYLWQTYGPARDMTGGYVDQDDLEKLLMSPTKTTATQCLTNQIHYWYRVGPEQGSGAGWCSDPRVSEIASRYGINLDALRDLAGGLEKRPPLIRHLELYPLKPLCDPAETPFVTTCEAQDVDCPECRRLMSTVRWAGIGWVIRDSRTGVSS